MYKVEVNLPNLAKGTPVEIDGLGIFKNGSTSEISDADALQFQVKHQRMETSYDEEGRMSHELSLGPDVVEAFKDNEHIKVTKGKADTRKKSEQPELPEFQEGADDA